jgi:glycosyltransferase involved in cell wall biosynthesis
MNYQYVEINKPKRLGMIPKVSIGMPVYNGEKYIRMALDSLLAQTFKDFELIISDNASSDRTWKILNEYATKDNRVVLYRQKENIGITKNFIFVLDHAQGEYFMWAACDDLWEPSYIYTLVGNLSSNHSAVLSFSVFNTIDEYGGEICKYPFLYKLPSDKLFRRLWNYIMQDEYLGKANCIYSLMRRSAIQSVVQFIGWKENIWGADMLLVFGLLLMGDIIIDRELLFHKRMILPSNDILEDRKIGTIFAEKISKCISSFKNSKDYLSGYLQIIQITNDLIALEKIMLQVGIFKKSLLFYCKEILRSFLSPRILLFLRLNMYRRLYRRT